MALPDRSPLTTIREAESLSLADLAEALNCGRSHLSRIERGEAQASPELANRIERFFKLRVTRDEVLFPEDYMPGAKKRPRGVKPQEAASAP